MRAEIAQETRLNEPAAKNGLPEDGGQHELLPAVPALRHRRLVMVNEEGLHRHHSVEAILSFVGGPTWERSWGTLVVAAATAHRPLALLRAALVNRLGRSLAAAPTAT